MTVSNAQLSWTAQDVPLSERFDDPYFSLADGLAETRHVFLAGNDLPERFAHPMAIAELGFGTGLNFLATWAAWKAAGREAPLSFTSFEAFPLEHADMARALGAFSDLAPLTAQLLDAWPLPPEGARLEDGVTLRLVVGDANETLPQWEGRADAWYLDGFSPAKNPELWGAELMHALAACTAPGGTVATYSAAGHVRRNLEGAGFDVARVPGFGRKRHMVRGVLRP